jgi:chromosome segregation ATPase
MDLPNHFIKCASNRRDPSNGFVNEVSSRATVEEQKLREARELKAKLAAEEVAKAAAKAAADNAQEFKRLRDLTVTYEIQIEDLGKQLKQTKSDFTDVQGKKTSLESSNSDLAKKLDSERVESARARQEASNHNNTIATLNSQLDARKDLDSNNNLDPGCHGRQAYLVHLGSRTAVDFGAGELSSAVLVLHLCTHRY